MKNAPDVADEPAASRGALLAAHARTLDSRLRVAAQNDRQATRRAAAHVVQLARRIARLLPRVPTLLPVLPDGGRDARIRHYVLRAQPVLGTLGTRILTISTHSVLRYGEFDGSGKPVLWNEYDPLHPVVGWDLETVLERLAEVLGQITEHVERLEARVAERAQTLNSMLNSSPITNRPLGVPAAPAGAMLRAPAPPPSPPPTTTISYGPAPTTGTPRKPVQNDDLLSAAANHEFVEQSLEIASASSNEAPAVLDESMPELALVDLAFGEPPAAYDVPAATDESEEAAEPTDLFPMVSLDTSATSPTTPVAPPTADPSADTAAERKTRERRLFQHLRAR